MLEDRASLIAIIYRSELDYLSRCIADYPQCETGGHLFGYWTVKGVPVILYVTGPGPGCMHGTVECHHDHEYYDKVRDILENNIALQHIGDWHSHHQLNLNHPSGGDVRAMMAGVGSQKGKLRRHLMCIGTYDGYRRETFIDAYVFHQNDGDRYTHAAWAVVEMESPFRQLADSQLRGVVVNPRTQQPNMGRLYTVDQLVSQATAEVAKPKPMLYWIDESPDNRKTLKSFVEVTKSLHPGKSVQVEVTEDNQVFLNIGDGEQAILFSDPFPHGAPYYFDGDDVVQLDLPWDRVENGLVSCFTNWLTQIVASRVIVAPQSAEEKVETPQTESGEKVETPQTEPEERVETPQTESGEKVEAPQTELEEVQPSEEVGQEEEQTNQTIIML